MKIMATKKKNWLWQRFPSRMKEYKAILFLIFSKTKIIYKIPWPLPLLPWRWEESLWSDWSVVKRRLSLSNKGLVILNSQSLGFLICKREIILNSFSYSEEDIKKTVCRGWPWAWPVVKSHKCLWILVRLGGSWEGFVGPVGSADCGACSWLLIVDAAIQIDLLSPKRFLGISFIDQKIRKEIRVFPWKLVWDLVANAAAAAKLLQSCPTLCDPTDGSPPGSCPWDSPGKNTGVGCHFLLQCMKVKVKLLSPVQLFAAPWTSVYQAPPSMGFPRQEYWSGLPLPSSMHETEKWKWSRSVVSHS